MPSRRINRTIVVFCLSWAAATPVYAQAASDETPPPQFRPTDLPLDEVGYGGLSGAAGRSAVSISHRTLPIPSYAEVTSLTTGRTILVLVDRRGPEGSDHLVDLSCGAARQLGLSAIPAAVRVRQVSPPEQERATLAAGRTAAARLDAPAGLLAALRKKLPAAPPWEEARGCTLTPSGTVPKLPDSPSLPIMPSTEVKSLPIKAKPAPEPVEKPTPVASEPEQPPAHIPKATIPLNRRSGYAIQVAALSNRARADAVARSIGGYVEASGSIYRVRKGAYGSEAAARAALPQIRAKGFADARVVTNEGR